MKKRSSSSIKNTGDKNVAPDTTKMSPQDRAERVVGKVDFKRLHGKAPLLAIVDRGKESGLSDFAFRVLTLFAVRSVTDNSITLGHKEIAVAMTCSERQAQRVVAELEKAKYVKVSRKHNCRNSYEINDPFAEAETVAGSGRCAHCGRTVKAKSIGMSGWCYPCINAAELTRQWQSAKSVLGAEATVREVAQHLGIEKQERKLQKALRRMGVAA